MERRAGPEGVKSPLNYLKFYFSIYLFNTSTKEMKRLAENISKISIEVNLKIKMRLSELTLWPFDLRVYLKM